LTVVGEIADLKDSTADAPTLDPFYIPVKQSKADIGSFAPPDMLVGNDASIVMRAALAPEQMIDSLRAVVRAINPQLPFTDIESMDRVVQEGQASRRFNTVLISSFAAAAMLLALRRDLRRYCFLCSDAQSGDGDSPRPRLAALQPHATCSPLRR
jgi:hypothetical protein